MEETTAVKLSLESVLQLKCFDNFDTLMNMIYRKFHYVY